MGLFSKGKQSCDICGKTIGFGKVKCLDGVICGECQLKQYKVSKIIGSNKLTLDEIKSYICSGDENVRKLNEFVATRKVGKFLEIDKNKQQWLIPDGPLGIKKNPKIYNFSDISSYELIEDNDTIIKDCFGSFNAKVAKKNVSKLYVKITVKDFNNPFVMIKIIDTPIKKNSLAYSSAFKSAQEIISLLEIIIKKYENSEGI
ncbi:hypothetical protein P5F45_07780 [Clostridium perfringens]|nr:hypothetical protein [Clostridium perfringens]